MLNVANPGVPSAHRAAPHVPAGPASAISDDLAMLAVDDDGRVLECNLTCEQRYGYRKDELEGRHIATLFPELRGFELVVDERINSKLAFLCQSSIPFQARHRNGDTLSSELFINRLGRHRVVVLARILKKAAKA
jgi:PAS domain S-box-containing protein